MDFPPLLRQFFVASAPQLASISVGGFIGFPGILLPQLKANNSTININVDTASWIGSTHGLAGSLACLTPFFMQYKGRKLSFILSCLLGIIGWIIIYFAQSTDALIIAEMLHGLGGGSMLTCSLITISEMVHPKFRLISMNIYLSGQALGLNLVFHIGRYFSWKVVSLIECCPIILALLISLTWPESPAWLAYKGEFDKCEAAFKWLRGTDAESDKELSEMIKSHKEAMIRTKAKNPFKINKTFCSFIGMKISQRDFYLPCLHMFVLICALSWSGISVVVVYAMDMLQQVTSSESAVSVGATIIYLIILLGNVIGLFMLKFFKNKTIIIGGGIGVVIFMIAACIVSYLQEIKVLPPDSYLCIYCLVGYTISYNIGADICIMSVAAELMPVKHRGIGGSIYLILASMLDFSTLKLSPYLLLYIKPWGTFLMYAMNVMLCMLCIWKYVPETKHRTLQEIEDYYNNGHFVKHCIDDNIVENIKHSNCDD